MKKRFIVIVCVFFNLSLYAQKDTTKKQTVDIVSSYKPVLRSAIKINLSGAQLSTDTIKSIRPYTIPSQNLFYGYQSISLKPLALQTDTFQRLGASQYIKVGVGNLSTPYMDAAVSFGDATTSLINVYGNYISSKGKIKYQDYSLLSLKGTGSYFFPQNELYGSLLYDRKQYFLYGYDHNLLDYKKEEVSQQFNNIAIKLGIRNTAENNLGIQYNPSIAVDVFSNKEKLSETNFKLNLPAEKSITEAISMKFEGEIDLTKYQTKNSQPQNISIKNNIAQLAPSIGYRNHSIEVNGGIKATWSNGKFELLPNIFGEFTLKDKSVIFQAGWVGSYIKNSYQNISNVNPYIETMASQQNTKMNEIYGGIKSSVGKHLSFSAKASFIKYDDYQFYLNDTAALSDGKSFLLSIEPKLNHVKIHGDISYINKDKFTATAGINFNGYTGMKTNEKAWNTLPMELTSSLRWYASKKLLIKADGYLFAGGYYLEKNNISKAAKGGIDLGVGAEYTINSRFHAFIDVNNIFGNSYERWHNYPVYGLNVLAGVIARF